MNCTKREIKNGCVQGSIALLLACGFLAIGASAFAEDIATGPDYRSTLSESEDGSEFFDISPSSNYKLPQPIKKAKAGHWDMYCYTDGAGGNPSSTCNGISNAFSNWSWNRLYIKPVTNKHNFWNMSVRFTNKGNSHTSPGGTSSTVHGEILHVALHEVGRQFGFAPGDILNNCDGTPFTADRQHVLTIPRNADKCKLLQGDVLTIGSNKNGARLINAPQMVWAEWLTGPQVINYQGGQKCYDLYPLTQAMCSGPNCGPIPSDKAFTVQIINNQIDPKNGYTFGVQPDRQVAEYVTVYSAGQCNGGAQRCAAIHTSGGSNSNRLAMFGFSDVVVRDEYLTGLKFKLLPQAAGSLTNRIKISDVPNDPMDDTCAN